MVAKLIGLEEHFLTPDMLSAWCALPPDLHDRSINDLTEEVKRRLFDLANERLRLMDEIGVDVQVLSLNTPGTQGLEPDQATALAYRTNDLLAASVRARPDRFQGLATLPTPNPPAAARELERAIRELGLHGAMLYGRTRDKNLDHPDFLPILEAAAALRAPLYLHPQSPQIPVRRAYYDGLGDAVDGDFATAGIGWHYETGIQFLRLVLAGVFDRLPDLQIIVGHWGEVVLFYLERIALLGKTASHLQRSIPEYFRRNLYVTPSGINSQRYLRWAIEVLGVERVMFSTDYPLIVNRQARSFVKEADLSDSDRDAISHGNWLRLCTNIRR